MQKASRKKTRRFLLQKLYARIYGNFDETRFQASFFEGILEFTPDAEYLDEMFRLVVEKQNEILDIIKVYAPKFDLDTMLKTNVLSLSIAITEMLYLKEEIPAKVSINEAIETTKYFGDDNSKKIVNGILNSFYTNIEKHQNTTEKSKWDYSFFQ